MCNIHQIYYGGLFIQNSHSQFAIFTINTPMIIENIFGHRENKRMHVGLNIDTNMITGALVVYYLFNGYYEVSIGSCAIYMLYIWSLC